MLNWQVYCVRVEPWESWKGGAKDKSGRPLLSDSLFSLFKLFYLFYNFLVYLYSSMDHLIYYSTLTFCIWKYGIYPRAASGLWKGWSMFHCFSPGVHGLHPACPNVEPASLFSWRSDPNLRHLKTIVSSWTEFRSLRMIAFSLKQVPQAAQWRKAKYKAAC